VHKTRSSANATTSREELLRAIPRLRRPAAQRKFLSRHPELQNGETASWLADAARDQAKIDIKHAISLAELAMTVSSKLRDRSARARALRAMGNALYLSGHNKAAVSYHQKAYKLFLRVRDPNEAARTLSASIQPLILLGQHDRALRNAGQARRIFTARGDRWRLARLDLNTGNIYYRQDRFAEALEWFRRAYRCFKLDAGKDPEAMGVALHNMAVCLLRVNDFHRALVTLQQARSFAEKYHMQVLVGQADYNIASLYSMRGEYSRAINMLLATREIFQKSNDPYHVSLCYLDLSEIYLDLNLNGPAEEMARHASHGFHKLGMGYEAGKSLVNLALAAARQEKPKRALKMLAEARQQFVEEQNEAWPFWTDFYRAIILMKQGRYGEARQLCAAANKFFRSTHIPYNLVLGQLLWAQLHFQTGKFERAAHACSAALSTLKMVDLPMLACQAQQLSGQIHWAAGRRHEAYLAYRQARNLLEATRSGLRAEELKIAFMEGRLEIYEGLVQLCIDVEPGEQHLEEAFGYMEQSKSRSLQDLISSSEVPEASINSEAQRRALQLRGEINSYSHQLSQGRLSGSKSSVKQLVDLQREIHKRENLLLRLAREMPGTEAESAGLSASKAATLQEIRESLPANSVLVEYFQVKDRLLAALLTRETLEFVPLTAASRVASQLERLEFQLAKFRLGTDYTSAFGDFLLKATQQHLNELHDALLAPFESRLQGQHLIVVPHGALHRLPFQALYNGHQYLIDKFTISYAPSATIYNFCQKRAVNQDGPALVMGVADAAAPLIREEALVVANTIPGAELFLGEEATTAALKERGAHCWLIHIATHGYFRQDSPMFSGIRLGDSLLSLYDLYRLKLPAELVTLSGCATGVSALAGGDELLGLVRGLIYAGARAALLTLWDVQDHSTLDFMISFYEYLMIGENKAIALQKAAWKVRERYPHPYYWAPFNLIGNL
jgi:CHAT domain-containing protein